MKVVLAAAEIGNGPPIVILHGLFGSARNWQGIARRLASENRVVAVDVRNHGGSPWHESMSFADMAEDVAALIAQRALGAPAVIGHSMGGKVAMALALTRPAIVGRLVVVDAAPVAYRHDRFGALVQALADLDLTQIRRRADADQRLAAAIPDGPTRQFLLQSLVEQDGRFAWRFNLDAIRANLPVIAGFPDFGGAYPGPTLFVHGALSDHVRTEHEPAIRSLFPNAEFARIEGAGHWVHADKPEAFVAAVADFLRR